MRQLRNVNGICKFQAIKTNTSTNVNQSWMQPAAPASRTRPCSRGGPGDALAAAAAAAAAAEAHTSPYPQIIKIFISAIAVVFVFAQQPPSVLPSIIQRDKIFCSLGASQTSITSPLTLHLFERGLGL
jgi:hypothetical protein